MTTSPPAKLSGPSTELDSRCIAAIRGLAIDGIEAANSGHPGLPLGAAPMAYVLWDRHLRFDPASPDWADRDRFVLSAGHGSMLQYALLHLTGYELPMEELKKFRQWNSRTPGHPEYGHTVGVEATTGPLGQGFANAVGLAVAERFLSARNNREEHSVVDHFTYALVGDGDLMEGVAYEAASFAGHAGLGKLIVLYDSNDISLDGPLGLSYGEDTLARFEACGWHVQKVLDGDHDLDAIDRAITAAKAEPGRPSLIEVKTTIGFGSPNKAGTSKAHGAPLGGDEVQATKRALGLDPDKSFHVEPEVREHFARLMDRGAGLHAEWAARFENWTRVHPDLAANWQLGATGLLPEGWDDGLPHFTPADKLATRAAGGQVLNALADRLPWLLGGDADLSESTKTSIKSSEDFTAQNPGGRNLRYGVREHAMGAIANGIAYHGGARTYTATFFCFADYMRPAIRLAAMNGLPVVNVFTHDSVALGEDGPTHQPVEHLMSLRVIPNLDVIRPGDANETRVAWECALRRTDGPTAIVLSRQALPTLDRTGLAAAAGVREGAYVLCESTQHVPKVTLIASGSELSLALEVRRRLELEEVPTRIVSMPSWELFERTELAYQRQVLRSADTFGVSIEAGVTLGWERWVGRDGLTIGVDRFGASAPAGELLERFGLGAEGVTERILQALSAV